MITFVFKLIWTLDLGVRSSQRQKKKKRKEDILFFCDVLTCIYVNSANEMV